MEKIEHILLVDDDEVANFINKAILIQHNIAERISVASDGEEALIFVENHWLDADSHAITSNNKLVLLDINMPRMNGFEFLEALEKIQGYELVYVVMLTSSSHKDDIAKAKQHPIKDYVEKPLLEMQIARILKSMG